MLPAGQARTRTLTLTLTLTLTRTRTLTLILTLTLTLTHQAGGRFVASPPDDEEDAKAERRAEVCSLVTPP